MLDPSTRAFHGSSDATLGEVEALCKRFRAFLAAETGRGMAFSAELVAREALINAAEHGCAHDSARTVVLDAYVDLSGMVELLVEHDGASFDPPKDRSRPPEGLTERGRGLPIMLSLSATCTWERSGKLVRAVLSPKHGEENPMESTESVYEPKDDLTAATVEAARAELMETIRRSSGTLRIDLSNVRMVDSKGIGLLIATYNSLQAEARNLEVTGASDEIRSLFKLMRLDRHFTVA